MGSSNVAELSDRQRLEEVTAIFAEGILRLRRTLGTEPKVVAQKSENWSPFALKTAVKPGSM